MEVDRAQDAKGKGKKGKNDHQKGKSKDAKGKGKKGKGDQKGQESAQKGRGMAKTKKAKVSVWQHATLVESQDILLKTSK